MSNVNRERKLKPYQRRIWTDAFKASLSHVSIEAAERKAWQAVDICERVGAFHESEPKETTTLPFSDESWKLMWDLLARGVQYCRGVSVGWEIDVADLASQFLRGDLSSEEFYEEVESSLETDL